MVACGRGAPPTLDFRLRIVCYPITTATLILCEFSGRLADLLHRSPRSTLYPLAACRPRPTGARGRCGRGAPFRIGVRPVGLLPILPAPDAGPATGCSILDSLEGSPVLERAWRNPVASRLRGFADLRLVTVEAQYSARSGALVPCFPRSVPTQRSLVRVQNDRPSRGLRILGMCLTRRTQDLAGRLRGETVLVPGAGLVA